MAGPLRSPDVRSRQTRRPTRRRDYFSKLFPASSPQLILRSLPPAEESARFRRGFPRASRPPAIPSHVVRGGGVLQETSSPK